MVSNISLNQFAPNAPMDGMYVYQANLAQPHNVIISAAQTTDLTAGAVLTLDSTSTNTKAPVAKKAAVTDKVLGIIPYNPVQTPYKAGDRVAIARANDIIWKKAAGAITVGADVYFTADGTVTATATAGNTIIGTAWTPATDAGDFIQVELGFKQTQAGR